MAAAVSSPAVPRRRFGSSTFASLSERDYRWYFAGNIAFFMGMQMQFVLRGYLAFDLTGKASSLGFIALAIGLPSLFVEIFAGVVADRVNKKLLLIVTQIVAAGASFFMSTLIFTGLIEFWHIVAISLVTGTVFSFNMPARSALVPLLVPQHKLMNAISLQMGGTNLTRIIAPATAGILIGPFGPGWVYLLTSALFSLAVASEFHLPKHGLGSKGTSATTFFEEFRAGVHYVTHDNRLIGMMVMTSMMIPLFAFPVQQMLPVFASEVFDRGPSGLGLLAACAGAGGLTGAIISANMDRQPRKGLLMLAGGLILGTFLVGFALTPYFELALVCICISGIGQMLFMTTNNTVIQAKVPGELRGRVNSLMLMSFSVMPLGVVPMTAASDIIGAQATVAFTSSLLICMMIVVFTFVKPMRQLRLNPLAHADLSPAKAAELVAQGKLTQAEADKLSGRPEDLRAPAASPRSA